MVFLLMETLSKLILISELVDKLSSKGVSIVASPQEDKMPSAGNISWFPMLLRPRMDIFMRQMQGGKGGAMGFGRSKAKLLNEAQGKSLLMM